MPDNTPSYQKLADLFSQLPQVTAVALGGSSTAAVKDRFSDYDIYIYQTSPVSREDRQRLLSQLGGKVNVGASFFEEGDEVSFKNEPYLDIMYRDVTWIENEMKDVWENCNARLGYTTCFVFNVKNSQILFDKTGWFAELQKKVSGPYPAELKKNIIWKNLMIIDGPIEAPYLDQIRKACTRDDLVSMNHRLAAILASLFDLLFAYSEVLHPGEKKLVRYLSEYNVKVPQDFDKDLEKVLGAASDTEALVPAIEKMMSSVRAMVG